MSVLKKINTESISDLRGKLRERLEKAKYKKKYPKFSLKEPKYLVLLPKLEKQSKINITYPILEPFVSVNVKWEAKLKHLVYSVIEPVLTNKEKEIFEEVKTCLTELIDAKISIMENNEKALDYLEKKVCEVLDDLGIALSVNQYLKISYFIYRDFIGLNEIESLFHDPYIEDIGCSGIDNDIYITHRKFGSMVTNIRFSDFDLLTNFVIKLSEKCKRYISYAMPLLDGTLPDGSRVQASLAKDVTTKGPTFSIRRFRRNPFSPIDMINFKTVSPSVLAYIWFLIEHDASMLVVGGVSTGKTSFLNVLGMFITPEKKIVSIEDVREINVPHENWIPATSRIGFGAPSDTGRRYGEVQLFELMKESFRMKPDYVIVGEVRGKEAYVLFQGMASGNPSLGTIHAGSVDDMVKRLETPPIELSPSLIESLDAVVVMVHARERGKSARRVKEIVEIESMDSETGKAHTLKTFAWIPSMDDFKDNSNQSLLLRKISFERGIAYDDILKDIEHKKEVIKWMQKFNIVQFDEVCSLINLYHKDKEVIMEWVKKGVSPYKNKTKKSVNKLWKSATGWELID